MKRSPSVIILCLLTFSGLSFAESIPVASSVRYVYDMKGAQQGVLLSEAFSNGTILTGQLAADGTTPLYLPFKTTGQWRAQLQSASEAADQGADDACSQISVASNTTLFCENTTENGAWPAPQSGASQPPGVLLTAWCSRGIYDVNGNLKGYVLAEALLSGAIFTQQLYADGTSHYLYPYDYMGNKSGYLYTPVLLSSPYYLPPRTTGQWRYQLQNREGAAVQGMQSVCNQISTASNGTLFCSGSAENGICLEY